MWYLVVIFILNGQLHVTAWDTKGFDDCVSRQPAMTEKYERAVVTCVTVQSDV